MQGSVLCTASGIYQGFYVESPKVKGALLWYLVRQQAFLVLVHILILLYISYLFLAVCFFICISGLYAFQILSNPVGVFFLITWKLQFNLEDFIVSHYCISLPFSLKQEDEGKGEGRKEEMLMIPLNTLIISLEITVNLKQLCIKFLFYFIAFTIYLCIYI